MTPQRRVIMIKNDHAALLYLLCIAHPRLAGLN
jgi:hypothetical protein